MNIVFGGLFFGFIIFIFTFIASKKSGRYYLAPIITFLLSIVITAYGFIFIGGFEGMAYGLLGAGVLVSSIIGTLILPLAVRNKGAQPYKRRDKVSLVVLPIILFATIGSIIYFDDGYWIIEQGETTFMEEVSYYEVSTIHEGRKQIELVLGEKYIGKEIEVEKVSKWGTTEITVDISEGEHKDKAPYIKIGIDKIKEPLKVQTTDGDVFKPNKN